MNSERILRNLSEVKEEYILEAKSFENETTVKKKAVHRFPIKKIAIAACIALVAIVGVWQIMESNIHIAVLENGSEIKFARSYSMGASDINIEGTIRDLTEEEIGVLFGDLSVSAYGYFDENQELIGVAGTIHDMKLVVSATERNLMCTVVDGVKYQSKVDGIPVYAGFFVTEADSKAKRNIIYYAEFQLGNNTIYVEDAGAYSESESIRNGVAAAIQELIEKGTFAWEEVKE